MRTKYTYLILLFFAVALLSCEDDMESANPPRPKDSPFSTLTVEQDTVVGGESVNFTIRVVDAPGLVDSVAYVTTDNKGEVIIDQASLDQVKGETEGTISGTFIAPHNASGDFTLTIYVYDAQEGDQQKRHAVSEDLFIKYAFAEPSFTASADENEVFPGNSTNVYFDVDAPAMIQNVRVFTSSGTIELDEASLEAVRGQNQGRVTAVYTAPSTPTTETGPVTFTVFVADSLQEIEISEDVADVVSVVYEFAAPTIEIEGEENTFGGRGYSDEPYTINVTAPGTVDTVIVNAYRADTEEAVGSVSIDDEGELEALIGSEQGSLNITLSPENYIGYIDLVVTVIDEQGASSTETMRVFAEECRTNLSGTYTTISNGTSTDPCGAEHPAENLRDEVVITRVSPGLFEVDDFFAGVYRQWYGVCEEFDEDVKGRFTIDCGGDEVRVVNFRDPFGLRVSGTGTYDATTRTMTIEWKNSAGDTATTVYQGIMQ